MFLGLFCGVEKYIGDTFRFCHIWVIKIQTYFVIKSNNKAQEYTVDVTETLSGPPDEVKYPFDALRGVRQM